MAPGTMQIRLGKRGWGQASCGSISATALLRIKGCNGTAIHLAYAIYNAPMAKRFIAAIGRALTPVEIEGTPEALAELELSRALSRGWSGAEQIWQGHSLRYLPTRAGLATETSRIALARVHGHLFKRMYQVNAAGGPLWRKAHKNIIEKPFYDYLLEIARYLCTIKVGIMLQQDRPAASSGDLSAPAGSPSYWQDATFVLWELLIRYRPQPYQPNLPVQQLLDIYIKAGYLTDTPSEVRVDHPRMFDSWREALALTCKPYALTTMLSNGFSFEGLPTRKMLDFKRSLLRYAWRAQVEKLDEIDEAFRGIAPGRYLDYAKVCQRIDFELNGTRLDHFEEALSRVGAQTFFAEPLTETAIL